MAPFWSNSRCARTRRRTPTAPLLLLLLCLGGLALLPGCSGCRKTPQQRQAEKEKKEAERRERERKEREEKKPDVEMGKLLCLPHELTTDDLGAYKPAHWTATSLPAKANNFHLAGDMEMTVVDSRGDPIRLLGLRHTATGNQQVHLPKGQAKLLHSVVYVPPFGRNAFVSGRINARGGVGGSYAKLHGLMRMPAYQYHFVVLARWPENYKYLNGLDSVKHPADLTVRDSRQGFYRVQLLRKVQETLPQHALYWTTVAYVLWDDPEPGALSLDQRVALLDWLHWGGQLIVSGPDSLDLMRNGFLSPYLPATSAGTRPLTAADFEELNAHWTLPVHDQPGRPLTPVLPWAGVRFDLHPLAREVPGTGGLLVERSVGRGRIVVSAFELDHPDLIKWPSFDGFFNACLLGRPRRTFGGDELEFWARWADATADGPFFQLDARAICKLRYFTRDTGSKISVKPEEEGELFGDQFVPMGYSGDNEASNKYKADVGAWSDFNAVAKSARAALQNAARIEIPERMFVVWVVGIYLLVLVPANWIVFRAIRRVEWAWAAAPLIAVVYTLVVIRLAQLDIGFARSLTEVSVVEIQGHYPRAHLTRYTALYTSLATTYEFRFEDPGAQVQPFPTVDDPGQVSLMPGQTITRLRYFHGRKDVRMRGFHVTSNATGLVHSEQMVDLGGPIALEDAPGGGDQVTNRTALALQGAGVIRRDRSGQLETAWIGTLEPGDTAPLRFARRPEGDPPGRLWAAERGRSPLTAGGNRQGALDLRRLLDLAEDHTGIRPQDPQQRSEGDEPRSLHPGDLRRLRPGDVRLIGWLDEEIPGLEIKPAAPQARRAAMVVAHLRCGFGEDPKPDTNTRHEFATEEYPSFAPDTLGTETR